MLPGLYDCHDHTLRSHDSPCEPAALCRAAVEKGLAGVAITNHCDMHLCRRQDVFSALIASDNDVHTLRQSFDDTPTILSGVEIGEGIWFPGETKKIYTLADWDLILGSVHTVRHPVFPTRMRRSTFRAQTKRSCTNFWIPILRICSRCCRPWTLMCCAI